MKMSDIRFSTNTDDVVRGSLPPVHADNWQCYKACAAVGGFFFPVSHILQDSHSLLRSLKGWGK